MKKKKGPVILIGVLVLLLILYFALSTWNKKQDSKEEETVKVTDLKTSEITGVKYDLGTGEMNFEKDGDTWYYTCLLYTSTSPRDMSRSRMPSSA